MAIYTMHTPIPLLRLLMVGHLTFAADFGTTMRQGQDTLARADYPAAEGFFTAACGEPFGASLTPDMRASCEHHLAIIDEAHGNYSMAQTRLSRALMLWHDAGARFLPSYVMSSLNLGELLREQGRLEEASAHFQEARDVARTIRSAYPQLYPEVLSRIAGLYVPLGTPELGRPLLVEALSLFRELEPRQQVEEARALNVLGVIDLLTDRRDDAELRLKQAVALSITASGPDHPTTAGYRSDLALMFLQDRQYDRAEPLLKRALFVMQSSPAPNPLRMAVILAELSVVACSRNHLALAEEYGNQAAAVLEGRPGLNTAAVLLARVTLGNAWLQQHRVEEAERILPQAVAAERTVVPGTLLLADGLRRLATLRVTQRSWEDAGALYREAIGIYESRLGPNNAAMAPLLREYADVLRRASGSGVEVKHLKARAKAIRSSKPAL